MEGYATVLHPPRMRLLPKGIPPLLEEILHAPVSAQRLQPVRPMAAALRREDEPVLRADKRPYFLHRVACDNYRLGHIERHPNHFVLRLRHPPKTLAYGELDKNKVVDFGAPQQGARKV